MGVGGCCVCDVQVTVLLKECRDIQLRYGSSLHDYSDDKGTNGAVEMIAEYDTEKVISDRLVSSLDFFMFDKQ